MSYIVIHSADIVSVSSFDLFIANYYKRCLVAPSLSTLKGSSVFSLIHCIHGFSQLELFLHVQIKAKKHFMCATFNMDQSDWVSFFPPLPGIPVSPHCRIMSCQKTVKAHSAALKTFWAVLFLCKRKKLQNCKTAAASTQTQQRGSFRCITLAFLVVFKRQRETWLVALWAKKEANCALNTTSNRKPTRWELLNLRKRHFF